ncbi:MAG: TetR/AcrR family transcriptional regulator [Pseudomonadota bacterium]
MFHFVDDKRGTILESALTVFLTYGFKKTSMDDIAQQAGVSRPALYQLFKNKTDIFRALSHDLMENAIKQAKSAFDQKGTPRELLFSAIDSSIMEMHRFCDQSVHGAELVGINQEIARDIEHDWKIGMIAVIADGIDNMIADGTADNSKLQAKNLDSEAVARVLMHSMEGMRETYLSGQPIEDYVEQLVDFIALSLEKDI